MSFARTTKAASSKLANLGLRDDEESSFELYYNGDGGAGLCPLSFTMSKFLLGSSFNQSLEQAQEGGELIGVEGGDEVINHLRNSGIHGPLAKFPRIFGHEGWGNKLHWKVWRGTWKRLKEGDSVVPLFLANYGECSDSKSPKSNMCTNFRNQFAENMSRDGTNRFRDLKGESVYHFLC
ncbi:Alcohol dehydrogenase-like 2, partial [Mucuna pruriens]